MKPISQIKPMELKERLDRGDNIFVIDVRESWERSLASIEGSEHFPLTELVDRTQEYIFEEEIVVYCHVGERSYRAAMLLEESGFKVVHNLVGGIDAWSQIVDPAVPRYRASM
jgi:rhodanese-related sulfurtransferase